MKGDCIMEIRVERIYTKPADLNGYRILVDRLWPRGVSKVKARLDAWLKQVGPSDELRKWFDHDPAKFDEFKARYLVELAESPAYQEFKNIVQDQLKTENVILLYGAKDQEHNQAVVLADKLCQDLNLK